MAADTGNLLVDVGRALLGVVTLGRSEVEPDPRAKDPTNPMRDRTISDEAMNVATALFSFGLYDREVRIAQRALRERERDRERE